MAKCKICGRAADAHFGDLCWDCADLGTELDFKGIDEDNASIREPSALIEEDE